MKQPLPKLEYVPVTRQHLAELETFSEGHGKFRYCSCMRWRMTSTEYNRATKEQRGTALIEMARQDIPVGVLACLDARPVAWCSIAPRETYRALERYQALPHIDATPVWAVVCFYVDSSVRRRGLTLGLLKAAVDYAVAQGAQVIEGYPVEPGGRLYTYMGSPATFEKAGFTDITPQGQARRVMRYFA